MIDIERKIKKCAADGMSKSDAARKLGLSQQTLSRMSLRAGITFMDRRERKAAAAKDDSADDKPVGMKIERARAILDRVTHPHWSPSEDYQILTDKTAGADFLTIATEMGRNRIAVEQRWQRLRIIPWVQDALLAYQAAGLSYERTSA